jgi:signal transduction histidine kinase
MGHPGRTPPTQHGTPAAPASERLSVLVVEDNAADADLVREMLREANLVAAGAVTPELHHVETLRAALDAANGPFDVALLDLGLPDASGLDGLAALNALVPELPAVVLTGARDPALAARALVAGAQDFLVKGEIEGELLLRSLRFAVARQRHVSKPLLATGRAPRARVATGPDRAPGSPRRVLLVEDNPADAELVRIALESSAHSDAFAVDHVERLRDALAFLSSREVDAVLLDLGLPDGAGVECIEKLRAEFPELPVVVFTGDPSAGSEAVRLGVQDYVVKGEEEPRALQRAIEYAIVRNAHAERARELAAERAAHAATQAAADVLRRSDERKDEFLALLSHELRNPLAPIRNSVHILERAAPGGEQARRAQRVIDRQVRHLTRLVDDLLDVARISRGKIVLRPERVDLTVLVREVAEDHRTVFANGGIELEIVAAVHPLPVNGDATRLAQIVGNLLHNAAKFTPRGGRAALSVEAFGAELAAIRVRDTGEGIAPEALEHVFEPFVQANGTLDRTHGGLGLGLALVKGLAELHGGTASAHSAGIGRGTEVTVTLPLVRAEDLRPRADAARPPVTASARRVLVIEDDVDGAETLRELLELHDHVVETAGSGPEGLEKARAFCPDVVLCDIGLPEMDGFDVASAMRADPTLRSTALVALSGYAAPADVERASEAGFDRHVAKPVDIASLERIMGEVAALERE